VGTDKYHIQVSHHLKVGKNVCFASQNLFCLLHTSPVDASINIGLSDLHQCIVAVSNLLMTDSFGCSTAFVTVFQCSPIHAYLIFQFYKFYTVPFSSKIKCLYNGLAKKLFLHSQFLGVKPVNNRVRY